uniref:Uncharacterized protein n=1 Tax=Mycena chlorophos TaxID=658473 RepID=A0ABQ0M473_MYCCL|nr:predicted protein [Mycena chlorophos]
MNYTLLDAMRAHPLWNTLTHLSLYDLFVFQMRDQIWDVLPRMLRLTHLRMPMFSKNEYTLPAVQEVVGLLYASPRLQVLVLSVNASFPIDHWQVQPTAGQDPRLVWALYASLFEDRVLREDWLRGARGLVDTWELAEEQVRKQRANPAVTGRIAVPE